MFTSFSRPVAGAREILGRPWMPTHRHGFLTGSGFSRKLQKNTRRSAPPKRRVYAHGRSGAQPAPGQLSPPAWPSGPLAQADRQARTAPTKWEMWALRARGKDGHATRNENKCACSRAVYPFEYPAPHRLENRRMRQPAFRRLPLLLSSGGLSEKMQFAEIVNRNADALPARRRGMSSEPPF